jgi:hypothetical protein
MRFSVNRVRAGLTQRNDRRAIKKAIATNASGKNRRALRWSRSAGSSPFALSVTWIVETAKIAANTNANDVNV